MKTPSNHYPPEYTQGCVEFFYRKFYITEDVLIPRFETESLVREAISRHKLEPYDSLMDMGTGSGIIPISIAKESTPFQRIFALDKSMEALQVATRNAEYHSVDVNFLRSDLFSIFNTEDFYFGKSLLLTANLPYVRKGDPSMSPDTVFEPDSALYGWEITGFELYEDFFGSIVGFFTHHRLERMTVIVEIGYDQRVIAESCLSSLGLPHTFFPDPAGIPRFITLDICHSTSI